MLSAREVARRQEQTLSLPAECSEEERATAAQGDAVGVCRKEFTPPPEPENKGLHEGVAQPVFNEAEHLKGVAAIVFVLRELEKRLSSDTPCVHASQ